MGPLRLIYATNIKRRDLEGVLYHLLRLTCFFLPPIQGPLLCLAGHKYHNLTLNANSPSQGPNNSWTLHGLWPDHCDGTYDANCDPSREYSNITAILQSYGKSDLLAYMSTFWKDYQGNDESFWEHEWDKHGTCISTLEPSCYNGYTGQDEVVDYFDIAVRLFKGLDSFKVYPGLFIVCSS